MKKFVIFLCLAAMMLSLAANATAAAFNDIKVAIDGSYIDFDVPPQIIDNRTMVPLRAIFEKLGARVVWHDEMQTVTAIKEDKMVEVTIGSKKMYINNIQQSMDVAPMIINNRTLVPARFAAEAFDCAVDWDEDNSTVYIYTFTEDASEETEKTNINAENVSDEQFTDVSEEAAADTLDEDATDVSEEAAADALDEDVPINDDIIGIYTYTNTKSDEMFTLIIYDCYGNNISAVIRAASFSQDGTDGLFDSISGIVKISNGVGHFSYTDSYGNDGNGILTILSNDLIEIEYRAEYDTDWSVSFGEGTYEKSSDTLGDFDISNIESGKIY